MRHVTNFWSGIRFRAIEFADDLTSVVPGWIINATIATIATIAATITAG